MSREFCFTSIEPVRPALTTNIFKERTEQGVQDHAHHAENQEAYEQFHGFSPFNKRMTFAPGAQYGR